MSMKLKNYFVFAVLLLCPLLANAALVVTEQPKITGSKAVVTLAMKNTFTEQIESARAAVFLLDEQGKMVGQSTKWVVGGGPNKPALTAGGTNVFHFVVQSEKPFTTTNLAAKVTFIRKSCCVRRRQTRRRGQASHGDAGSQVESCPRSRRHRPGTSTLGWVHGLSRLFTVLRAVLWAKLDLPDCQVAMGQPRVAFATRRDQNKRIFRVSTDLWDSRSWIGYGLQPRQAVRAVLIVDQMGTPGSLGTYGFLTPPYGLPYGLELKNNPRLCTSLRVYASNTPQEAAILILGALPHKCGVPAASLSAPVDTAAAIA